MPTRIIRESDGKTGTLADGYDMPPGFRKAGSPMMEKVTRATDPMTTLSPLYRAAGQAAQYSPTATIPAGISALLGRTPEQTQGTREFAGNMTRDVALSMLLRGTKNPVGATGPVKGPLGWAGNAAQQGALAGSEEALQTGKTDKMPMAKAAGVGAALPTAVSSPLTAYAARKSGKAAKAVFDKAMEAMPEQAAAKLMDFYTQGVRAWSGLPKTVEGLKRAILGEGPDLLSKDFEKAFNATKKAAKGLEIDLSPELAKEAGLKLSETGKVGAADALEAVTGKSKKIPDAYHAVIDKLDQMNLIDKEAYRSYKTGQSLLGMAKNTPKVFEGGAFNPQEFINTMETPGKMDPLMSRGVGNYFEGPFADMRNIPQPQPGYTEIANPFKNHPLGAWVAGEAPVHAVMAGLGMPGASHFLAPMAGLGAMATLPRIPNFGVRGPIAQPTLDTLGGLSGLLGTMGREYAAPPGSMTPPE